jgi:hypothetical protein
MMPGNLGDCAKFFGHALRAIRRLPLPDRFQSKALGSKAEFIMNRKLAIELARFAAPCLCTACSCPA